METVAEDKKSYTNQDFKDRFERNFEKRVLLDVERSQGPHFVNPSREACFSIMLEKKDRKCCVVLNKDELFGTTVGELSYGKQATHLELIFRGKNPTPFINERTAPRSEIEKLMWLHGFSKKMRYDSKEEMQVAINNFIPRSADKGVTAEVCVLSTTDTRMIAFEFGEITINKDPNKKPFTVAYVKPFGYWFAKDVELKTVQNVIKHYPYYKEVY